jgi:CDP-diacylglycerol--glycerol-3-phosphate 3-phosphatidyltransferase
MAGQLASALLIVALILMDTFDGLVARWRREETLLGSAIDIAADRAVEIVLWVMFAYLRVISLAIPLTFVIRGALTDSIRNVALRYGLSAHGMMRSKWGRWLVASPAMRSGYALVKALSFVLLAVALALRTGGYEIGRSVWIVASAFSWVALAICLARGIPVLVEAPRLFGSGDLGKPSSLAQRVPADEQAAKS